MLYWFSGAAVPKRLNNRTGLPHGTVDEMSEITVWARLAPSEGCGGESVFMPLS